MIEFTDHIQGPMVWWGEGEICMAWHGGHEIFSFNWVDKIAVGIALGVPGIDHFLETRA